MLFFNVDKTNFIARCSGVRVLLEYCFCLRHGGRGGGTAGGIRIIKTRRRYGVLPRTTDIGNKNLIFPRHSV